MYTFLSSLFFTGTNFMDFVKEDLVGINFSLLTCMNLVVDATAEVSSSSLATPLLSAALLIHLRACQHY